MNKKYQELIKQFGEDRVKVNEPLSMHTTFKIGGPADLFYEAQSEEEVVKVIGKVRDIGVPYFLLAAGSNVLIRDKGFRGIIIKLSSCGLQIENSTVTADAGLLIMILLNKCQENSLTGLEFMAGIPGTIGGAIRGNAGAWRQNIGDFVKRVKILSVTGEVSWIDKNNCSFSYRESRFKNNDEIILGVEFSLKIGEGREIDLKIQEFLKKRETLPKEPSAGCVFVNPKPQSAGKLIDRCGLKKSRLGNAQISRLHANFIVNLGGAKAVEVESLIKLAKSEVKRQFGVDLKEEIVKIGEI